MRVADVCPPGDAVARRVLEEYGALFVASRAVRVPPACVFACEEEVARFQAEAEFQTEDFDGELIELQPAAMRALLAARDDVRRSSPLGLDLTPRDGREAARRTYADTLRLWDSRYSPALTHWHALGRLSSEQVEHLRSLAPRAQVAAALELEREGIFFSKDFSKTVLQSVAAPGTSPHLSMTAFDAVEFRDESVRRALARHGWFQTVLSDLPHFTFIGVAESELPARGLRSVTDAGGQKFWIPDV